MLSPKPGTKEMQEAAMAKQCSIHDCDKDARERGWCHAHYMRWRNHGDPLGGAQTPGYAFDYFREIVLNYEGDECLFWPYGKNNRGYATVTFGGRLHRACRVICEATHGPPPTGQHHAAHSCGNGHIACVTKRHLSWKTPKANNDDKLLHGTHQSQKAKSGDAG